jgi:hypothetical protein
MPDTQNMHTAQKDIVQAYGDLDAAMSARLKVKQSLSRLQATLARGVDPSQPKTVQACSEAKSQIDQAANKIWELERKMRSCAKVISDAQTAFSNAAA